MTSVAWKLLVLSFAHVASAQVQKRCSAPAEYPNVLLDQMYTDKQTFSQGERVYYNCEEDFRPTSGLRFVRCSDGKWTRLTLKCEKKTCGYAGEITNGEFVYEGDSHIGEQLFAKCYTGYVLKGDRYLTCASSGWVGVIPSCEVSSGTEATCSPPAVANSVRSSFDVYQVGESMTFTCRQGFQLDGDQQITCGSDGQWQTPPPRCLPSPVGTRLPVGAGLPVKPLLPVGAASPDVAVLPDKETGECGVPQTTAGSHTSLADQYITKKSFASGDKVYYVCDVGYVQAGGSRSRICTQGQWTRLQLRCEPYSCGSAGEIQNGEFTYTGIDFGDTATAVCNEGYRLVGRDIRRCMNRGWDGRIPVCEAVVCEDLPVTNAQMTDRQEPPFTYRTVIRYQCRVGTLSGPQELWCTKDGTWNAAPPTCSEMTCQSPNVPNGYWVGGPNKLHSFRETIAVQCKQGYKITGPSRITCDRDGSWSPGLPTCTRTAVDCRAPPVTNAERTDRLEPPFTYRTVLHYRCRIGTLKGQQQIRCTEDGTWDAAPPTCSEMTCRYPKVPNMLKAGSPNRLYRYRDAIDIQCKKGYRMTGHSRISCNSDGSWYPGLPTCTPMTVNCDTPPVTNAERTDQQEPPYKQTTTLNYRCLVGTLKGPQKIWCKKTGKWNAAPPTCSEITCPSPNVPNAYWAGDANRLYKYRDTIEVLCRPGDRITGQPKITCGSDGSWSPGIPTCTPIQVTCSPPAVANSVRSGGDVYQVGESMTFTCSQGFQLDGDQQITCGSDGQWQTPPPRCLPSPVGTRSPDKTLSTVGTWLPNKTLSTAATASPDVPDKETGECGVPQTTAGSHTSLADQYVAMKSFASGDQVHYMCDVGYVQAGGSRSRICTQGQWTRLQLRCEPYSCGSAGEILNGEFTYTGVEFGDTATAVCNEGYRLVGRDIRRCMNRGWDGRIPVCEAVVCEDLPVTNAQMTDRQEPPFTYRTVIRYQCRVGTLSGPQELWCTKDGTWNAAPPTCSEMTCQSPNVPNGYWVGGPNKLHSFRETIAVQCKQGYKITGPSRITCDRDGSWSPGLPTCTRTAVDCRAPPVTNAERTDRLEPPFTYRAVLHYQCRIGTLKGQQQIRCTEDGTWDAAPPTCSGMTCRAPHVPNVYWAGYPNRLYRYRETIDVQCRQGYRINGQSRISCDGSGSWSPGIPTCTPIENCAAPPMPNAERSEPRRSSFTAGSVIYYRCLQGYRDTWYWIQCTENGTWNAAPAKCIAPHGYY